MTILTGSGGSRGIKYIKGVSIFELIDLSVPIEHNMDKYPTDPTIEIMEYKSYDKSQYLRKHIFTSCPIMLLHNSCDSYKNEDHTDVFKRSNAKG
jgi:hypothetical protein